MEKHRGWISARLREILNPELETLKKGYLRAERLQAQVLEEGTGMLREVATPGSLLWWLARSHPSSWACAQPFSCVNTLLQSFPLQRALLQHKQRSQSAPDATASS